MRVCLCTGTDFGVEVDGECISLIVLSKWLIIPLPPRLD